ncbi:MAG: SdiA-regulated domain-containing protein [Bacteroidia bacterium]
MKKTSVLLSLICCSLSLLTLVAFYPASMKEEFHYQLTSPQKSYVLPTVLNEVSGLTTLAQDKIACVQDEKESIFVYDLEKEVISKEYSSEIAGDYEELALVGSTMYLLRSDGVLIEYVNYTSSPVKTKEYQLNLPSPDNEGLCYDKKHKRLLIAAKSKTVKEVESKQIRLIYGFDLTSKTLLSEPVYKLDIHKIEAKAKEQKIPIPTRTIKKTGKTISSFNFRPSAIAIHPFENSIYVLSASDRLLLIIDEKGNILELFSLNLNLFNKAEGLTFLPNGDMLISNEAQDKKPTILKFEYKKS